MHFPHSQVFWLLRWDVQLNIWCQEFYYIAYCIWGFKIQHYSCPLCVSSMLAVFDTVQTLPHSRPFLPAWNTYSPFHSAQNAHAHLLWPHSVIENAAIVLASRWRCFYLFKITFCQWPTTEGLSCAYTYELWRKKRWPCGCKCAAVFVSC